MNDGLVDSLNLYEQIADRLEREIISKYALGQRLPSEQQLSERYQVSRPVMREAMKLLKERGLVDSRTGSGAYVTHPEAQHVSDILTRIIRLNDISFQDVYHFRSILEIAAVKRAVEKATDAELEDMEDLLTIMQDPSLDVLTHRDADFDFHLAIARASGNRLLVLMVETMRNLFQEVITAGIFVKDGIDDGIKRHRRILDALKARDAERAAHMMYSHLYHSEMNVATYLREHGHSPSLSIYLRHNPQDIKKEEIP